MHRIRSLAVPALAAALLLLVLPVSSAGAAATGTIEGVVTAPGGVPAAGVYVYAQSYGEGDEFYEDTTRSDGSYELAGIAPGTYYVGFSPPAESGLAGEFWDDVSYFDEPTPVIVTAGGVLTANAELGLAGVITGTVELPPDLIIDPFDFPPFVAAQSADGDFNLGFVESDGSYAIGELLGGTYYVSVESFDDIGLAPAIYDGAEMPSDADPVAVVVGETTADIDLVTRRCGPAPFTDVPTTHPFCIAIEWADSAGVASGFPDGTYRPGRAVTRAAMASFLWNQAGSPPGPFDAPDFVDVPSDHPFFAPISWMASEGITTGYPDGTFRPNAKVTRQATAAFMWRVAGEPGPGIPWPAEFCVFDDVCGDHPFADGIFWMTFTGIAGGFDDNTFRPGRDVTRQAMASFLHRGQSSAEWDELLGIDSFVGTRWSQLEAATNASTSASVVDQLVTRRTAMMSPNRSS